MPQALPVALRQTIIDRHLAGAGLPTIARDLARSPWTVRTIWRRYRDHGAAGVVPDYAACGRAGPRYPAPLYAAALAMRRQHRKWGAGLIRVELADAFPGQPLPHEATLRRWFREAGVARARPVPRPPDPPRATLPHARWQLDATEEMRLADGTRVSWLAASDEATGALLGAVVFPLCHVGPGRSARRAGGAAGVVCPVGPAPGAASGQRRALGWLERCPARSGAVAAGAGHRADLEQAAPQAGQRRHRERPWRLPALGRSGDLSGCGHVANAPGLGGDHAA